MSKPKVIETWHFLISLHGPFKDMKDGRPYRGQYKSEEFRTEAEAVKAAEERLPAFSSLPWANLILVEVGDQGGNYYHLQESKRRLAGKRSANVCS